MIPAFPVSQSRAEQTSFSQQWAADCVGNPPNHSCERINEGTPIIVRWQNLVRGHAMLGWIGAIHMLKSPLSETCPGYRLRSHWIAC